jgi:predicted dehydrogenase
MAHAGRANGTMGDLSPHMINCALALMGPITDCRPWWRRCMPSGRVRDGRVVTMMTRPADVPLCQRGCMGHLYFSRVATGRKMGYAYEVHGTKGRSASTRRIRMRSGFTAPRGPRPRAVYQDPDRARPSDYLAFCRGRGMAPAIRTRSSSRRRISAPPSPPESRSGPPSAMAWRVSRIIDTAFKPRAKLAVAGTPSRRFERMTT